jgi:hypothetical protein
MLLLIWPRYSDDAADGIDYSEYAARPRPAEPHKRRKEPEALRPRLDDVDPLPSFDESEFKQAQAELSDFYQSLQVIIQGLDDYESQRAFLLQLEEISRILFEKEAARRREEEEILAFLLCQ